MDKFSFQNCTILGIKIPIKIQFIQKLLIIICLILFFSGTGTCLTVKKIECVTNEFPPFGFLVDGKIIGIEVEIMREIGKRLDIEVSVELRPWQTMLETMRFGTKDCMFAAFYTADREKFMDYTKVPIHISSLSFFVHKHKPMLYNRINDLAGMRIGIVKGFKNPPDFEKAERKQLFQVFRLRNLEINFRILDKKCINAVLVNKHVGEYTLSQMKLPNIEPMPVPLTATPAYIAFSKKKEHTGLIEYIDSALYEILLDGTYKKIFDKYMKKN